MNVVLFFFVVIVMISVADTIEAYVKGKEKKRMDIKFTEEQNQRYLKDIREQAKEIDKLVNPVKEILLAIESKVGISDLDLEKKTHLLIYIGEVYNKLSEIEKLGKKGIQNG